MSDAQSPGAYLDEVIERALAPYADKVPPDVLEEMREELRSHPTTYDLAKRLRARAPQMKRRCGRPGEPGAIGRVPKPRA